MSEISRVALFGKLNPPGLQGHRGRDRVLQAARQPVRRAGALDAADPAARRTPTCTASSSTSSSTRRGWPRTSPTRSTGCRAARPSISDLSAHVESAVERGWVYGTLMFGEAQVRTGHLVVGHAQDARRCATRCSASRASSSTIKRRRPGRGLRARSSPARPRTACAPPTARRSAARRARPAARWRRRRWASRRRCKRFTVDLTERARKGEIDPIVGRDEEIRQIVDILMRRRQNNPILTGEAGVGKTAVVEGFALRIAARRRAAAAARTCRCARSTSACCRPAPA